MKNSSDTIGNRTRDLPTCSAVPQPTALPRALKYSNSISTKPPVSGVSDLRMMSQVGRVREVVSAYISVSLQSEMWRIQYTSAYVVAAVT